MGLIRIGNTDWKNGEKMKRAKCRLCNKILEVHYGECISCACGELTFDWLSDQLHVAIKSTKDNLLFVDDEGNEIIPVNRVEEGDEHTIPRKEELLSMLNAMSLNIDNLPQEARLAPITHSDFGALLTLLCSIFRAS